MSLQFLIVVWILLSTQLERLSVVSLNAKAWQCIDDKMDQDDFPETSHLLSRSNTAIGFSGGGEFGR